MPENKTSIAFWGPTGVGKSWLLDAFKRQLDVLTYEDETFEYRVEEKTDGDDGQIKIPEEGPRLGATKDVDDIDLLVTREPKQILRTRSKQTLNKHTHHLQLRDIQGSWAWDLDPTDSTTSVNFQQATGIVIVLDHIVIGDSHNSEDSPANNTSAPSAIQTDPDYILETEKDDAEQYDNENEEFPPTDSLPLGSGNFTKRQWVEKVGRLAQMLEKTANEYRIAVCVTKIDQSHLRHRPASEVIESLYGRNMRMLLNEIRKRFAVKEFCVSAVGYLPDGKDTPNFDPNREMKGQMGYLRDEDNWRPYNVHAPFFWMFEHFERQRLSNQGNWLARQLFQERRLNMYLPYPGTNE